MYSNNCIVGSDIVKKTVEITEEVKSRKNKRFT